MESKTKAYFVEPHRKPRRKIRRRPLTMREIGIDVVVRDGQFVVPSDARHNTPFVIAINVLTVQIYNDIAESKIQKMQYDAAILVAATEAERASHQESSSGLRQRMQSLREVAHRYRKYVVNVEGGRPVNEPLNWDRE